MPVYNKIGPFTNGSAPGINKAFLDGVENQLSAVQYGTNFITPYLLINNVTINTGNVNTYTCTGVGGIPAGATGVLLAIAANGGAGNYLQFAPHGGSLGSYPLVGNFQAGVSIGSSFTLPLDGSGKIDVKSNGSGSCALTAYIYGYIY